MNKWFFQLGIVCFTLAGILAVAGYLTYPSYRLDTAPLTPKGSQNPVGSDPEKSSAAGQESALLAAAKDYSRRLGPPIGNLVVTLEPKEAVDAGAAWAISSGNWHASGYKLENVKGGQYTLELKPVADWKTPEKVAVEIKRDETLAQTVTYERIKYGNCLIKIGPAPAVTAGAQWQLAGRDWKNSDQVEEKVVVGDHPVQFKPVEGWRLPQGVKVTVAEGAVGEAEAVYQQIDYGSLTVAVLPENGAQMGLKWRLQGKDWGATPLYEKLETGSYELEFQGNDDWQAPPAVKVDVKKDAVAEVGAEFIRIPKGSVLTVIDPNDPRLAGAQWQLDNGPWLNGGDHAVARVGKHMIAFKAVAGWGTPPAVEVEVVDNQQVEARGAYQLQKPPAPPFTVTVTIAAAEGRGLAYIRKPGDVADKLYRTGEKVGDYILEKIRNGYVVLVKDGFDYRLEIPKPDPSRQIVAPEPEAESPANPAMPQHQPPAIPRPGGTVMPPRPPLIPGAPPTQPRTN